MKPGRARDVVTIKVRRRVETDRSWKYEDTKHEDISAEIEESSGLREVHEGSQAQRIDAKIMVRPLGALGVKLRDRMEVVTCDGREFDVLAVWPKPRGIPLWWVLRCQERRVPRDDS